MKKTICRPPWSPWGPPGSSWLSRWSSWPAHARPASPPDISSLHCGRLQQPGIDETNCQTPSRPGNRIRFCAHNIYIYIYIYRGHLIIMLVIRGWGVVQTGKSYSFRSCVRASEAVCASGTMLFPWLGCGSSRNPPGWPGVASALSWEGGECAWEGGSLFFAK